MKADQHAGLVWPSVTPLKNITGWTGVTGPQQQAGDRPCEYSEALQTAKHKSKTWRKPSRNSQWGETQFKSRICQPRLCELVGASKAQSLCVGFVCVCVCVDTG